MLFSKSVAMSGGIDDSARNVHVSSSPMQLTGTHEQGVVSEQCKANPNGVAQDVLCDTWVGHIAEKTILKFC